jgi:hypothetical protein
MNNVITFMDRAVSVNELIRRFGLILLKKLVRLYGDAPLWIISKE